MNIEDDPGVGLNAALAWVLEEQRAAQEIRVTDLSEESGIALRTLQRYLGGDRHISIAVLERLAPVLGKKPSTLLRLAERRR